MQRTEGKKGETALILQWEGNSQLQRAWLGSICLMVWAGERDAVGPTITPQPLPSGCAFIGLGVFTPLIDRIFPHGESMDEMKLAMEIALAEYIALEGVGRGGKS